MSIIWGSVNQRRIQRLSRQVLSLALPLLITYPVHSQQLLIRTDVGVVEHIPNRDPSDAQSLKNVPSLGEFFANGPLGRIQVAYALPYVPEAAVGFFFAGSFGSHWLSSGEPEAQILGKDLRIMRLGMAVGIGGEPNSGRSAHPWRLTAEAGPTINFPEGRANLDSLELRIGYKPSVGIAIALGAGLHPARGGFGFGASVDYSYAPIIRDDAQAYLHGSHVGRLSPTGDGELPDYNFGLGLYLCYAFDFRKGIHAQAD